MKTISLMIIFTSILAMVSCKESNIKKNAEKVGKITGTVN